MSNLEKKKIWVFAFEYAGIAKVGGLGEVSANQCRSLASDPNLDLQVFMPGHDRHNKLKESHNFAPLMNKEGEKIVLKGHFDPAYFGISTYDVISVRTFTKFQSFTDASYFEVEIWSGLFQGVNVNLLVGNNSMSKMILNDENVYGISTLNAKLGLFSHVMKEFMRYCIYEQQELVPEIIHAHDHHPLGALICCKQELNLVKKDIKSIITMHLLTWPRRDIEFFWKSGVNNEPMRITLGDTPNSLKTMRDIYTLAKGDDELDPTLEKVGSIFSDKVIAVSENFLKSDIIPNCGGHLIEEKSEFTWNGCDWDYNKHKESVVNQCGSDFLEVNLDDSHNIDGINSWDLRSLFLRKYIGKLNESDTPLLKDKEIKSVISELFSDSPYRKDCTVESFNSDGPMVLVTGRVSPQKGIENIFHALPHVIEKIPDVKFIFLMIPTPYTLEDLRNYMSVAKQYPENVRFIFGIARSIYLLAHLSADVYCCPSRWEPFGIVALEAMASKIPVVATYVGGLQESVLHIEDHPETGTGLLCPNNDGNALKNALISLISTMQLDELTTKRSMLDKDEYFQMLNTHMKNIVHPILKNQVIHNMNYGETIRNNCLKRVESTFRWKKVSEKLKNIYLSKTKKN